MTSMPVEPLDITSFPLFSEKQNIKQSDLRRQTVLHFSMLCCTLFWDRNQLLVTGLNWLQISISIRIVGLRAYQFL